MDDEWFSEDEGFVPEEAEEKMEYAEVFQDRERAGGGGAPSFKTASDKTIKDARMASASLGIPSGTSDSLVNLISSWPNHQVYNPEVMVYAALYASYSSQPTLTKSSYAEFLARIEKISKALVAQLNSGRCRHADVIRYIKFFIEEKGKRGIEKYPFR